MRRIVFSAAGDSITAGYDGVVGWPVYAIAPDVRYASGWFKVGLRSDQIVDGVIASGDPGTDVLVVMGCTNDILLGYPTEHCLDEWGRLDAAVATPLIVSAIAPSDVLPAEGMEYNEALERLAERRGWVFVDPWTGARESDGTYVEGMGRHTAEDPVHPSGIAVAAAAAELRESIRAFVQERSLGRHGWLTAPASGH